MENNKKDVTDMADSKYHFERLTPIDDMDLEVYEDAIDYVFGNPDIKNVAITGAYSAGKSSVLASYKKKHEKLRFLHISLAHFQSPDKENVWSRCVLRGCSKHSYAADIRRCS